MNTTQTPGYNRRIAIYFAADKHGRRAAYRYSPGQFRAFRMSLAEADLLIATEAADVLAFHPMRPR